jgi:predicted HicB family RNase H-like nuclease
MPQSGSIVVVADEPRESLNLRVPPDLKRQVEAYAKRLGISVNAAASILLAEGFRAEQKRTR